MLGKKPKAPSFSSDAGGRSVVIRSSVESHKIIYGEARVSGPMAYATTANTGPLSTGAVYTQTNLFLHIVIPLAGHEVEDIGDIYLNDKVIVFDAAGFATTSPYFGISNRSYVRIRKHLGSPDQEADDLLTAEVPGWSAAHRLRGIVAF